MQRPGIRIVRTEYLGTEQTLDIAVVHMTPAMPPRRAILFIQPNAVLGDSLLDVRGRERKGAMLAVKETFDAH